VLGEIEKEIISLGLKRTIDVDSHVLRRKQVF